MPYFVTVKKTHGVKYLYVMYSTYLLKPDGTKQKIQKVIRSFGRLEPLLEQDPEFVEKLKQQYPNKKQLNKFKQDRLDAVLKRENEANKAKDKAETLPSTDKE